MKRIALPLLILLLGLAGCQTENTIETSALPNQAVAPTATAGVIEAIPTPESDEIRREREWWALKNGEDVYIYLNGEDDILNNYTSYDLLTTPPKQIKRYVRCSLGDLKMELFCGEMTSILILDGEKAPQEFSEDIEYEMAGIGSLTEEDLNFDGYDDLRFFIGGNRGGQAYYAALLKDTETQKYTYASSFSHISSPCFDREHQVIWGGSEFLFGYYYDAYEFIEGEFVNTHGLIGDYPGAWENGAQCTEYMWKDGEKIIVGQTHFPEQGVTGAVKEYIEASPVWEGWRWCDPDLFVMKG